MKDLIIEATISTPKVEFSVSTGVLKITGICTPENPKEFFLPITDALLEFQGKNQDLIIEVFLDYFNSGSSKALLNIFIETSKSNIRTIVRWISEDEELKESGIIFEEITGLKFDYIDIKN
jgi:hypothetical protein